MGIQAKTVSSRNRSEGRWPRLLLVQRPYVGDDEARREHRFLDRVPHGILGVVEDDRHPSAWLEDPAILLEASLHQILVLRQILLLGLVDDRLWLGTRQDAVPRLDEIVEVRVVDVLPERRIGEYVVDGVVRDLDPRAVAGSDSGVSSRRGHRRERLLQPLQLPVQDVSRSDIDYL